VQFSKCLSPLLLLAFVPSVVLAAPARTVVPQPARDAGPGAGTAGRPPRSTSDLAGRGGGAIELAAGTYVAPTTGFHVTNPARSFTIRAASGRRWFSTAAPAIRSSCCATPTTPRAGGSA